ncbi:Pyridoxal-dependent decarboxylase conserved domain containing protein [Reticulomyxa filosa]|uniref:Pyridoxal-dependent decarboxylase conserved domain containing protein n=1 Tax=Reticulomyxa filosa TaxID=46433 RepID=X6N0P4_RETFI|nr:Pyridoxal-dependent decarboxylase conserved domain containing protein [Reticulomyxa filosa]|eukprot:ETO19314.1 Pyridoxal-dependent decarboxylase conserved domain containing protein [Reticulomyxa filosa]
MEKLVDRNTICLVGSAPGFPHGVVDDIPGICKIAKKAGGIPVHVDNCLGWFFLFQVCGFVLSMINDAKLVDTPFDFQVEGVTSISCDLHKQIGSPKGVSAILYRDLAMRRYQFYSYVDWSGGLYATATFKGSGNGGLWAAAWANLVFHGYDSIQQKSIRLQKGCEKLCAKLSKIDDVQILGNPVAVAVAFRFKDSDKHTYALAEALKQIGHWQV